GAPGLYFYREAWIPNIRSSIGRAGGPILLSNELREFSQASQKRRDPGPPACTFMAKLGFRTSEVLVAEGRLAHLSLERTAGIFPSLPKAARPGAPGTH